MMFGSLVMRLANDFHSWLRHSWKLLANRLTRDQTSLFTVTHALFFISLFVILWILVDTPNECSVACKQICKIALTWILRRSSQSLRVELLHKYIVVTFTILSRLSFWRWRRVHCLKMFVKIKRVSLKFLPCWKIFFITYLTTSLLRYMWRHVYM